MKPNILKSNLFSPGTKFIATNDVKDTTLPPYSLGFFSFFKNPDRDYQDVVYATVIIIRRGKTGQERIEQKEISFPIFTDKRMLDHDDYLPTGRKFYIHIKKEVFNSKTLMGIIPLEFLGWSLAYARYLKYITQGFIRPAKRASWSEEMVDKNLIDADKISSYFSNSPGETLRLYSSEDFRRSFIMSARKLESKLTKCICSYKKLTVASILNSSYFIDYTNDNYYEVTDKKLTKDTVSFYKDKYKKISDLVEKNKVIKKKGEA